LLDIVEQHTGPIDLLLSDVVMPQMSGPAVARKLAAIRPEVPVLYMSGYVGDALQRHGIAGEDVPILNKPFGPGPLIRKVQQVIVGSHESRRARPPTARKSGTPPLH
jgi:CheY-like chemotaxis protein